MSGTEMSGTGMSGTDRRLPVAPGRRTWAALRTLARPHRTLAVTALLTAVAATTVYLLTAPVLGNIVDRVIEDRPASALTGPITLLVAIALGYAALAMVSIVLIARLGEQILAGLREQFVERALALPLEQVEAAGSGDLTSRVTNDVSVISQGIRQALPEFTRAALTIALTVVGLAVLDWRFALAALLAAPIQVITVRWYLRNAPPLYAKQRAAVGDLQQELLDSISGAPTVRAFGLRHSHLAKVTARSQHSVDLTLAAVRLQTRFFARLNLAELVGLSAVLATGYVLVENGDVTVGAASAAALYFANLFNPINVALASLDEAQSAAASLARLVGVLDLPGEPEPADPAAPPTDPARVDVEGVGHAYVPGHDVLDGVDLSVAAGERVAVVGTSGAGKTTLAKLVAGVHTPTRGRIRLDGIDAADLGAAGVRRTVALVTQEVHVFAGPLADDLRLVRPDATDEDLRRALTTVGAAEWVDLLPAGLATEVGEGGHELTVAQAQQLALARLLLVDPPVAILDEATAEAGSAGARALEAAATEAMAGRTALVVAHRLTQAATADRVVVLDAGRVVEVGTHDDLVAAGGVYARLWSAWSAERSDSR